jgi:hypothetical protein
MPRAIRRQNRMVDVSRKISEELMFEWSHNVDEGLGQAKEQGKLVLLDFSAAPE